MVTAELSDYNNVSRSEPALHGPGFGRPSANGRPPVRSNYISDGRHFAPWFALYAPKGTPKDIVARLNVVVANALSNQGVRWRFNGLGFEIPERDQLTSETLAAVQKADIEKWWPIIKAAGIKAE
jgi:hypothetical protein